MENPQFKTLKSDTVSFGARNFIEVALKESEDGTQFVSLSKGFTDQQGNKRYKRSLGFAVSKEVIDFLIEKLTSLKESAKEAPRKEETPALEESKPAEAPASEEAEEE